MGNLLFCLDVLHGLVEVMPVYGGFGWGGGAAYEVGALSECVRERFRGCACSLNDCGSGSTGAFGLQMPGMDVCCNLFRSIPTARKFAHTCIMPRRFSIMPEVP